MALVRHQDIFYKTGIEDKTRARKALAENSGKKVLARVDSSQNYIEGTLQYDSKTLEEYILKDQHGALERFDVNNLLHMIDMS